MLPVLIMAELPASMCDNGVKSIQGQIALTGASSSTETTSCTFTKNFNKAAYFELQRFYTGNEKRYKHSRDSIFGITIKSSTTPFNIQIHNDRIEMLGDAPKRCFGAFKRPGKWKLKIQMHTFLDMQKTVVSIASSRSNRFKDCFQFEIEAVVDFFQVSVHGSTQTGMTQIIHNLDEVAPENTETFAWNKLARDVEELRKDLDTMRTRLAQTRVEHLTHKKSFENNHGELKESLTRFRIGHRDKLTRHSWTTYGLVGFLFIVGLIAMKWMKDYIRKRDKIF
jgi:hypothetical protein